MGSYASPFRLKFALIILFISSFLILYPCRAGEILLNPGFEDDKDADGFPDWWILQRYAVADHDPLLAFEGNVSARASFFHSCIQVKPNMAGGTRLAFSGFLRGDIGGEYTCLACEFQSAGQWRHYQRSTFQTDVGYAPFAASFLLPPDADSASIIFNTRFTSEWARGDAFSLIDEFIHNSDFEEMSDGLPTGWFATGHPVIDSTGQGAFSGKTEVRCDWLNYFYQDAAVYPDKTYTLVFHIRTDEASPVPDALTCTFFDERMNVISEKGLPFSAEPLYKRFTAVFAPPAGTVQMCLSLRPSLESRAALWFDALALHACTATPPAFSPNGDGIYDTCSAMLLLGEPSTVSLQVTDAHGFPVRQIAPPADIATGTHTFTWDGRVDDDRPTTPGRYLLLFTVENMRDGSINLDAPVDLQDLPPLMGQAGAITDMFPRGLWIHLSGRYAENIVYKRLFAAITARSFDTVIASWPNEARLSELLETADASGVRIIPHTSRIDFLIRRYYDFAYEKVSEAELRDEATSAVLALASHPSLLGYYLKDEVTTDLLDNARTAARALRSLDPAHPIFSEIPSGPELAQKFDALDTAVLLNAYYPIASYEPVKPEIFEGLCTALEAASGAARAKNRPLWMILQGFASDASRMPTPAEMHCQVWLALAYNAKGIFYFLAQSLYELHGLFSFDEVPFPILDELALINHDLAALSPVLLQLSPAEEFSQAPPDHTVRSFQDASGTPHVIIVNRDCLTTRTPELVLNLDNIASLEDVLTGGNLPFFYEAGQAHVPLVIAPGCGRLIRIQRNSGANIPLRAPREAVFSALSLPNFTLQNDSRETPSVETDNSFVSLIPLAELTCDLAAKDGLACVAAGTGGLQLYDVARPWAPRLLDMRQDLHNYESVSIDERRLFCADPWGGMVIYEPDPAGRLSEIGKWWGHTGTPLTVVAEKNRTWLASGEYGLTLLDTSDVTSPVLVARSEPCELALHVIPHGDVAYVMDEFLGIHVEDISTSEPVRIETIPLNRPLMGALCGDALTVACGDYGVKVFSIKEPHLPVLTGEVPLTQCDSVAFYRKTTIFASAGLDGIAIIELDGDGRPHLKGFHQPLPGYYALRVVVDDPYLYILYPYAGIYILSPDRLMNPNVGRHFDGFATY